MRLSTPRILRIDERDGGRPRGVWYAAALVGSAMALVAQLAVAPLTGNQAPYLLFYPAVVVAALAGGLGPGLVATGASVAAVLLFVVEPGLASGGPTVAASAHAALFVAAGALVSVLGGRLEAARAALRERVLAEERAAGELGRAKRLYQHIDELSPNIHVVADLVERRVVYCNPRVTTMLGYDRSVVLDGDARLLSALVHEDDLPVVAGHVERLAGLADGEVAEDEVRVRTATGAFRWLLARSLVFSRDEAGRPREVLGVLQDVTGRRTVEDALRASQAVYARIVESGIVGVAFWQAGGGVVEANDAFLRLFDLTRDDVEAGRVNLRAMTPPGWEAADAEALGQLERAGRTMPFEKSYVASSGREVPVLVSYATLGGTAARGLALVADLTELKVAQRQRDELLALEHDARVEAEAASRAKDEFLAVVSHELRTPLNAVLGWSRLLAGGRLEQRRYRQAFEAIERNANALARLIEDVLDISRLTSGKVRIDARPIGLLAVVESVLAEARPQVEASGLRLDVDLDPRADPITADPERVRQIVTKLVSNAVKFTPRGGRVTVAVRRTGDDVEIVVADTGVGIPAEHLGHVFERFRQVDGSTRRAFGGLGLGLAIVRRLVELHGGTIAAASAGAGRGTTITVRLPVSPERAAPPPGRGEPAPGAARPPSLVGIRALVVDDDADSRLVVAAMLAPYGAVVRGAATAAEAYELVRSWRPSILIADVGMPEVDGYDLIARIRSLAAEEGGLTPAIALTGYARQEDERRALDAGFQLHLTKPVTPEVLVYAVARLLGRV